ncbi:unnamed protein product [Nezara viridula]|uniref:Uncharacterized protein n=1 Tax=Nezara viridula TaxID=85310 RepID=A0A9P0H3U1_NEZVI|nr:unnamed protein product [Nezara viridula]
MRLIHEWDMGATDSGRTLITTSPHPPSQRCMQRGLFEIALLCGRVSNRSIRVRRRAHQSLSSNNRPRQGFESRHHNKDVSKICEKEGDRAPGSPLSKWPQSEEVDYRLWSELESMTCHRTNHILESLKQSLVRAVECAIQMRPLDGTSWKEFQGDIPGMHKDTTHRHDIPRRG